jgi:osmotically-inducible protein OsmY
MWILRMLLILVVLVAAGFLVMGYVSGRAEYAINQPADSSATVAHARERAADIGQQAAVAATRVEESIDEAATTTKIKAKMALDDTVKARAINVTTRGTTVTLSGTVQSVAEHDRAVALARETDGVSQVIDDLYMLKRVG